MPDQHLEQTCRHAFTGTGTWSSPGPKNGDLAICGWCGSRAQFRDGDWHVVVESKAAKAMGEVQALRTERDRYRDALQRILDMGVPLGREGDLLNEARQIAGAAIGDGNQLRREALGDE